MNGHADTHTHTNERERFELFRPILNYTSVKGLVSYQEEKKMLMMERQMRESERLSLFLCHEPSATGECWGYEQLMKQFRNGGAGEVESSCFEFFFKCFHKVHKCSH